MSIYVAKNGSLQTIKGIYECKDMLREGVDYQLYTWLDSTSEKIRLTINETDFQSLTMFRIGNPNTNIMRTTQSYYGNQGNGI